VRLLRRRLAVLDARCALSVAERSRSSSMVSCTRCCRRHALLRTAGWTSNPCPPSEAAWRRRLHPSHQPAFRGPTVPPLQKKPNAHAPAPPCRAGWRRSHPQPPAKTPRRSVRRRAASPPGAPARSQRRRGSGGAPSRSHGAPRRPRALAWQPLDWQNTLPHPSRLTAERWLPRARSPPQRNPPRWRRRG
jgi:hypothetical protein